MFRQVRMATNQTRMPVLSALPTAYFVSGDTGLKQTTEAAWANKLLNVEELAAIVPIPEAVFDDAGFDVWGSIAPLLQDAIARALDAAVIFGTNKPASWGGAIVTDATTAGNVVNRSVGTPAPTRRACPATSRTPSPRSRPTASRSTASWRNVLQGPAPQHPRRERQPARRGLPDRHLRRPGLLPDARPVARLGVGAAEAIVGDWSQAILGIRQDITYKVLDQSVITDAGGLVQYNLAQQDMIALRVVFRCAFQTANTSTTTTATRAPATRSASSSRPRNGSADAVAGTSAETSAAVATAGFVRLDAGDEPGGYTLQSGSSNKKGSAEPADTVTRIKQFYR
jgi:hypothetical protein